MCTVASTFFFTAVHSIVRNPEITGFDYAIVAVLVVALYIENQVLIDFVYALVDFVVVVIAVIVIVVVVETTSSGIRK